MSKLLKLYFIAKLNQCYVLLLKIKTRIYTDNFFKPFT